MGIETEVLAESERVRAIIGGVGARFAVSTRSRMPDQPRDWAAGSGSLLLAGDDGRPGRDPVQARRTGGDPSLADPRGWRTRNRNLGDSGGQRQRGRRQRMRRDPGSFCDAADRRAGRAGQLLRMSGADRGGVGLDRRMPGTLIARRTLAHSRDWRERARSARSDDRGALDHRMNERVHELVQQMI